ncbi:MAG TPA: hypothetical protein VGE13_04645 [Candidatus Saccharimonadales bacterium]
MALSGEFHGEDHPATFDTYVDDDGHEIQREKNRQEIRRQLSGIAFGDGDVSVHSFVRPERAEPEDRHDHGPDN